ncbi:hypothetical protein GOP47_0001728 [Adiantum capillus-veneris]|uniref:non-specific serine/threonine protein kinase n=1 Tax=Adiantum capillus-veneris TaxID=13818 RepID=A0A9D4ZQZ4_ADICA|nr:hypothetical protein GOP47_0001728 [Adiantum capillus-veneris]
MGEKQLSKRLFACLFPCFKGEVSDKDAPLRSVSTEGFSISHDSVQSPLSTPTMLNDGTAVAFNMAELNKATSNFSTSCKIGQGGFGVVYKGKLADGRIVAIKRARKDLFEARLTSQFLSEVNTLAKVEHLNLVKLIGYLEEGDERILVEEFVSNGNLRQHLDCEFGTVLDLFTRLDIAIDISHALTYLHLYAGEPIIHRDVKASNILLTDSVRAKVADFGFSRIGPLDSGATHVVTQVKGTAGYLDPEYLKTYKLSSKSDVYAFGVLMIELLTGRRPIEHDRHIDERITLRWAYGKFQKGRVEELVDPRMDVSTDALFAVEKMFEVAFQCVAPTRQERPTMKKVSEFLWMVRKDCQRSQNGGSRRG